LDFRRVASDIRNMSCSEVTQKLCEAEKESPILSNIYEQTYQTALVLLECSDFYEQATASLSDLLQRIETTTKFLQNLLKISQTDTMNKNQ
jgi:hypothetical protein